MVARALGGFYLFLMTALWFASKTIWAGSLSSEVSDDCHAHVASDAETSDSVAAVHDIIWRAVNDAVRNGEVAQVCQPKLVNGEMVAICGPDDIRLVDSKSGETLAARSLSDQESKTIQNENLVGVAAPLSWRAENSDETNKSTSHLTSGDASGPGDSVGGNSKMAIEKAYFVHSDGTVKRFMAGQNGRINSDTPHVESRNLFESALMGETMLSKGMGSLKKTSPSPAGESHRIEGQLSVKDGQVLFGPPSASPNVKDVEQAKGSAAIDLESLFDDVSGGIADHNLPMRLGSSSPRTMKGAPASKPLPSSPQLVPAFQLVPPNLPLNFFERARDNVSEPQNKKNSSWFGPLIQGDNFMRSMVGGMTSGFRSVVLQARTWMKEFSVFDRPFQESENIASNQLQWNSDSTKDSVSRDVNALGDVDLRDTSLFENTIHEMEAFIPLDEDKMNDAEALRNEDMKNSVEKSLARSFDSLVVQRENDLDPNSHLNDSHRNLELPVNLANNFDGSHDLSLDSTLKNDTRDVNHGSDSVSAGFSAVGAAQPKNPKSIKENGNLAHSDQSSEYPHSQPVSQDPILLLATRRIRLEE